MRRILIDTDTASDDAVALTLALLEPSVRVEAITVVAGNVPVDQGVRNARIAVEFAGTYYPPVHRGMERPLLRELVTATVEHGEDGLSGMPVNEPKLPVEAEHAVDALARLASEGGRELVTLGPLTNVAAAVLKAPQRMRRLERITIMAGAGLGQGNVTPAAEYNAYVDAAALQIVLQAGIPIMLVGWDASLGPAFLNEADLHALLDTGSRLAQFWVRCNQALLAYNRQVRGRNGIDLPDPAALAAAIYPEIVLEAVEAYTSVEVREGSTYGQVTIDAQGLLGVPPNLSLVRRLDGAAFKRRLFEAARRGG
jgi:purine nucleosidase